MSEWVSVDDALPEVYKAVWVYCESTSAMECDRFQSDMWDGWDWIYLDGVTHWMPLPEPPKDQRHNQVNNEMNKFDELMQQLHEKEARIARLIQARQPIYSDDSSSDVFARIDAVINETPQQSLAAIQADAVEKYAEHVKAKAITNEK